ncbi:Hsp20/alpha crystallin family protein [Candidatus Gottesmanbacteria bacterium]|nr:Hsp20/alpha crystallin family protein [Candidatus Gottesmanbacteria bacterium]
MAFDLIPGHFWRFPRVPSIFEEDDDFMIPSSPSGLSISEDDKNVYIEAAVPGVDPKDIEVTFDKGVVWIKGESKEEEKDKKKKYYRQAMRQFSYRVAVPGDIDPNNDPEAHYKNGVMRVTFIKSPRSQPRKITVKS